MSNYPDILMMTDPLSSIGSNTLNSICTYARKCNVILNIEPPIYNMSDVTLLELRYWLALKASSDWVVFLDTDDALDMNIPSNTTLELEGADMHLYNYYDVSLKQEQTIYTAGVSKLFGFHMVICKRELALEALRARVRYKIFREDICFLYEVLTRAKKVSSNKKSLAQKFGSRVVRYATRDLRNNFSSEVINMWEPLFKKYIFNKVW